MDPKSLGKDCDSVVEIVNSLALVHSVCVPFFYGTRPWRAFRELEEEVLGAALYSYSMNFLGLPAALVSVDVYDGVPIGVQIAGSRYREDLCLDAAEAVEQRAGVLAHRLWERDG